MSATVNTRWIEIKDDDGERFRCTPILGEYPPMSLLTWELNCSRGDLDSFSTVEAAQDAQRAMHRHLAGKTVIVEHRAAHRWATHYHLAIGGSNV